MYQLTKYVLHSVSFQKESLSQSLASCFSFSITLMNNAELTELLGAE